MTRRSSRLLTPSPSTPRAAETEADIHSDDEEGKADYTLDGVTYDSYQGMVEAKRQRNQQKLVDSGLLQTVQLLKDEHRRKPTSAGIKRRAANTVTPTTRRKSNRIAGVASDGRYVEDERAGKFTLAHEATAGTSAGNFAEEASPPEPDFYRGRLNDGEDLSIEDAIQETGPKWIQEDSVTKAEEMMNSLPALYAKSQRNQQHTAVSSKGLASKIDALSADDEQCVAKVVPDRIYGIAVHPSTEKLLVAAGDKSGYVGLWDADNVDAGEGTYLFKFHSGAAACLSWTPTGASLVSASYDGTVRVMDVETQKFRQVFATYDDAFEFASRPGANMDTGYRYWTQYACSDHRSPEAGVFVSTSVGTAMHIDWRMKTKVTFHETLSEKKINTLSLHPNGHTLLAGGLDCLVQTWDIRKFEDDRLSKKKRTPKPLASYNCGKSVNSAYFSPSGQYALTTTQANKLDLFENAHTGSKTLQPDTSIRHDNMTGRWLSTFMAIWHPTEDVFCVGSMRRPRAVELFDANGTLLRAIQGDALTAVASRCCFHPRTDQITIVGGNSSGRVTVLR